MRLWLLSSLGFLFIGIGLSRNSTAPNPPNPQSAWYAKSTYAIRSAAARALSVLRPIPPSADEMFEYLAESDIHQVKSLCAGVESSFRKKAMQQLPNPSNRFPSHREMLDHAQNSSAWLWSKSPFWLAQGYVAIRGREQAVQVLIVIDEPQESLIEAIRLHATLRLRTGVSATLSSSEDIASTDLVWVGDSLHMPWSAYTDRSVGRELSMMMIPLPQSEDLAVKSISAGSLQWQTSRSKLQWTPISPTIYLGLLHDWNDSTRRSSGNPEMVVERRMASQSGGR